MAASRNNSESQDEAAVDLSNVSRQISEEIPAGNVELCNDKLSQKSESHGFDPSQKDNFNDSQASLHRSVSSNDVQLRTTSNHSRLKKYASSADVTKTVILRNNVGSKKGNMVLQLVLPSNENGNLFRNTDDIAGSANKRQSVGSQHETYSTIGTGTECYVNQAYTNDLAEYARTFAQSPASIASSIYYGKPTSAEDKNKNFRKHLTNILSTMYALFVITLGIVIYITDIVVTDNNSMAEAFSMYLVIIDLIFILYIIIDIKRYLNERNRRNDLLQQNIASDIQIKESSNGDYELNIDLPDSAKLKRLEHYYCFSKDKHADNFYLKIGASVFCLGHLIHSGLLVGYQILFLTSDEEEFYKCASVESLILDVLYPIYSFFLLYFLFKYANIIINRRIALVRFGLMHCLSSSVCFWIWTILRETIESLSNHDYETETETHSPVSVQSEIAFFTGQPVALPLTSYYQRGAKRLTRFLNASMYQFGDECRNDAGMSTIYRNYSPYLYPFSVEYSILVVGVLFVIWQSIGKCKEKEEMSSPRQCDRPVGNDDNLESNIVIHVDCHSANKGLFGGIVVMVMTVVGVILFLIAVNDSRFHEEAMYINTTVSLVILMMMTIAGIFAYRQITKLDVHSDHLAPLDDLLLFTCVPAFFLNSIVATIPAIESSNFEGVALIFFEVAQVLVQTPLIIDGLRRCSNTKELRKKKPGRELLTFLIVCNVAMWIMQTFEVKSHSLQDDRHAFFGEELWTIIGHLCVPLMMFYRFHSSVCIVDIWKIAYEPSGH